MNGNSEASDGPVKVYVDDAAPKGMGRDAAYNMNQVDDEFHVAFAHDGTSSVARLIRRLKDSMYDQFFAKVKFPPEAK